MFGVVFNSTSSLDEAAGSATTATWNHTCNAADTRLDIFLGGRQTMSTVTYNGVSCTKSLESPQRFTYEYNSHWYLNNPPTGSSYAILATYSSASTNRMGAAAGSSGAQAGVGATAENSASGSNANCVTNITTNQANSVLLCGGWTNVMSGSPGTISFGAGQTNVVKNTVNGSAGFYIDQKATTTAGAYSGAISVSGTGLNLDMLIVELTVANPTTNYLIYGRPRTRSTSNPISLG